MRKIIFAFGLGVALPIYADLGEKIQSINSLVQAPGQSEDCQTCQKNQVYGIEEGKKSKQQRCIESICPMTTSAMWTVWGQAKVAMVNPDAEYDKGVGTVLDKIARENSVYGAATAKDLRDFLQAKKHQYAPVAVRLFNFLYTTQFSGKLVYEANEKGEVSINREKSREALKDLDEPQFTLTMVAAEQMLRDDQKENATPFAETDPQKIHLYYSEKELAQKIDSTIKEINQKAKLIKSLPEFQFAASAPEMFNSLFPNNLKREFSHSDLSKDALVNLNDAMTSVNMALSLAIETKENKIFNRPIDLAAVEKQMELFKRIDQTIGIAQSLLALKQKIVSDSCRFAYEYAKTTLPSANEKAVLQNKLKDLQSNFAEQTKGFVCPAERDKYLAAVKSWEPNLPPTWESYRDMLLRSLERQRESAGEASRRQKETKSSPYQDSLKLTDIISVMGDTVDETANPLSDADKLCEKNISQYIPDAANFEKNSYVVGPVVAKDFKANHAVTNHEMGHKLYAFLADAKEKCGEAAPDFEKVRSCLAANHLKGDSKYEVIAPKSLDLGAVPRFEFEDFADLVSATLGGDNIMCSLIQQPNEANYAKISIKQINDKDIHSSDFFRFLHFEFVKTGGLSPICSEAAAASGGLPPFKNCFLNPDAVR
jgi:hypothetical protein